jgi:hypothetical protein
MHKEELKIAFLIMFAMVRGWFRGEWLLAWATRGPSNSMPILIFSYCTFPRISTAVLARDALQDVPSEKNGRNHIASDIKNFYNFFFSSPGFGFAFMHIYKHESHATISATDMAIKNSFTSSGTLVVERFVDEEQSALDRLAPLHRNSASRGGT